MNIYDSTDTIRSAQISPNLWKSFSELYSQTGHCIKYLLKTCNYLICRSWLKIYSDSVVEIGLYC